MDAMALDQHADSSTEKQSGMPPTNLVREEASRIVGYGQLALTLSSELGGPYAP